MMRTIPQIFKSPSVKSSPTTTYLRNIRVNNLKTVNSKIRSRNNYSTSKTNHKGKRNKFIAKISHNIKTQPKTASRIKLG